MDFQGRIIPCKLAYTSDRTNVLLDNMLSRVHIIIDTMFYIKCCVESENCCPHTNRAVS